ncbi:MAG: holo-ACP synthase [Acidobacteriota bacterium]
MSPESGGEAVIGLGIDLVELDRFRAAWERRGERLLERIFTWHERRACLRRADPVPELAVRFAAKEATFKAIGTGWRKGVRWVDVEVRNAPSGRPYLLVSGRVAEIASELGGRRLTVSLTHSAAMAAAQVLLLGAAGMAPWREAERIRAGEERVG